MLSDDLPSFLARLPAEPAPVRSVPRRTPKRVRSGRLLRAAPPVDFDDREIGISIGVAGDAADFADTIELAPIMLPHEDAAADDEPAAEDGGGTVTRKVLPGIRMIGQQASNWCWSAVTQAVNDFFDGASPSQDAIATAHISLHRPVVCMPSGETRSNSSGCTTGGCKGHCNNAHIVRIVLDENRHFDKTIVSNRKPTFAEVKGQIDAGRPLPCRIGWDAGGGHFILVTGWTRDADGQEWVHVHDPKQNEGGEIIVERILAFTDFVNNYTLMGSSGSINYCYGVK